jgi:hypothetical protein
MERAMKRGLAVIVAVVSLGFTGCETGGSSGFGDMLAGAMGGGALDDGTIGAGLKQALEVGTTAAVSRTSAVDGYLGNPLIRIPLPESLDTVAKGMRAVGFGAKVDELEVGMNRAAEAAAGEAADVFWQGIKQMTFSDVRAIWSGGDTAATEFFERTTRSELSSRFQPIVDDKMSQVGLVQAYDDLIGRYTALPFMKKPDFDMRSYVTDKGLDGLFSVLGEEEKKIRTNPSARSTELLQKVFGASSLSR